MNARNDTAPVADPQAYDPDAPGGEEFLALMRALGDEMGGPIDGSLGFACINLNDIDFVLAHGDTWGRHNLCVACEFGAVPADRRLPVLEAALRANGDMQGFWSPVFSLEPVSDCLVLTAALPLFGTEAPVLLTTLLSYVMLAENWRSTYFLAPQDEPIADVSR